MNKTGKLIIAICMLSLIFGTGTCFAADYVYGESIEVEVVNSQNNANANANTTAQSTASTDQYEKVMGDTPASQEEMQEYINTKGFSIAEVAKTAAKWILAIAFIAFLVIAGLGLFGSGSHLFMGLAGCAVCGFAFFCVMYSTEILNFISVFFVPDGEPVRTFYDI